MFTRVLFPIALSKFRCTEKVYLKSTPFVALFCGNSMQPRFVRPQVVTVTPSILTNNLPFGSVGVFPLTSPLLIRKTTAPLLCCPSKKPRGAPLCLNYLPNPLLKQSAFPFYMFLFPFYLCKTFTRWPLLPPPICNPLEYKRTTRISYRVFVCDVARYGTLASQPRCAPEKPCLF